MGVVLDRYKPIAGRLSKSLGLPFDECFSEVCLQILTAESKGRQVNAKWILLEANKALKKEKKNRCQQLGAGQEGLTQSTDRESDFYIDLEGTLTDQERKVAIFCSQGFTYREIAAKLKVSLGTIQNLVNSIRTKTSEAKILPD